MSDYGRLLEGLGEPTSAAKHVANPEADMVTKRAEWAREHYGLLDREEPKEPREEHPPRRRSDDTHHRSK